MTVDEELNALDDAMRRLKVEYDVYFGGGSKKPPTDMEWRVQSLLKRHSDTQKLNFAQRFRYNSIAQRYAIFSELWRQKLRIKEEGYRRPQDAILSIQGVRTEEEHAAAAALKAMHPHRQAEDQPFVIECSDVESEVENVRLLFDAMLEAKRRVGEPQLTGRFDGFLAFLKMKTDQIRRDCHCEKVEYRVEVRDQKVRLKAKPKTP
ncbi:MAG: MXAN_5187 C-terminal domain-containing protein [Terriglobales bacterium]